MWFPKQHDSVSKPGNLFSTLVCGFETTFGLQWSQNYMGMWIRYFACFYLTKQLESVYPWALLVMH